MRLLRYLQQAIFECRLIRYPPKIKLVTIFLLILGTSLYIVFMYDLGTNRLRDAIYLQHLSCPACYGRKMCNDFHSGAIQFVGISRLPSLHFLNVKNVHHALWKDKRIVLKQLAHDSELREADQKICRLTGHSGGDCNVGDALFRHEFNAGAVLHPATVRGLSDLVTCPSPRLLQRIDERFNERENYLLHSEQLMIYTTLMINPEPIVLQVGVVLRILGCSLSQRLIINNPINEKNYGIYTGMYK